MSCKYNNCKICGYKSECEIFKENAELRRNEFNARSCLELQQSQDKAIVNYIGDQLTKAKELLKKMSYEYRRLCLIKKETLAETEQFLSENERQRTNKGVTMFEKEAEKYRKYFDYYRDWHGQVIDKSSSTIVEQSFKDGAEFGYNKANEWHYPSKGEYPKDKKDMLMSEQLILLTKLKGTNNLSISIGQYNFSTLEFSYPHIVGLTDVIAWKEIVLPELPKESGK